MYRLGLCIKKFAKKKSRDADLKEISFSDQFKLKPHPRLPS